MADIVLPVVGGVTGFVLGGPSGAILGANLGGMAAGMFFPKSQRVQLPTQEGPRLADLRAQISTYGNMIPKVYGTMRLAGNVIWATDIKEVRSEKTTTQTSSGGGKGGGGGGKTTTSQTTISYEYFVTLAIAICEGQIDEVIRVWADSKVLTEVEHLLASVAAHHREKNAEQVKNRMRARMQNGFWVFNSPCGYKFERKGGEKILVRDEPAASIVKTVLEGFASGRFDSQTDIIRFLQNKPDFPRDKYGKIHITRITEMLERVLYTGYIEYKPWGIPLQPGKHEALISFQTFNKIQERLRNKANVPNQPHIHLDFPLRGYVACGNCGKPMTACWSAGGGGTKYPYYLCRNQDCSENKKSIKRDLLEREFEKLLQGLTPTPDLMYVTRSAVKQIWQQHHDNYQKGNAGIRSEIRDLERKIEQFLDRIVEADNASLIRAYEAKVSKMEREKASLEAELAITSEAPVDFENSFQTVFDFIGNPQKLWHSEHIEDKRLVLKLVFTRPVKYHRKEGFQTPAIALPFALSRGLINGKSGMVEHSSSEL